MTSKPSSPSPPSGRCRCVASIAALLAAFLLPLTTAVAEEAEPASLAQEIVAMLEASVPEAAIFRWMETQNLQLEEVTSEELIALHGAGASEDLLSALFDRVRATPPPAPAAPSAPGAPGAPEAPGDPALPPRVGPTPDRIEVSYRPEFDDGEEPWDLHVYLDGSFLASIDGKRRRPAPLVFERDLRAGPHSVLFVQERHDSRKGAPYHEARAGLQAIPFELPEGAQAQIELRLQQPQVALRPEGAVYVKVMAGGQEILRLEKAGEPPLDWQRICEEVESNVPQGERPNGEQRRQLKNCVSWSRLWPEGTVLKSRQELHGEML